MPYSARPHDVVIFLQNFLLLWIIKLIKLRVGRCSPKCDLQYITVSFTVQPGLPATSRDGPPRFEQPYF